MRRITRFIRQVPKSLLVAVMAMGAVALPLQGNAQTPAVRIEANTTVANQTAGDTNYTKSVNAKVDDVLKVQLWYHNMEDDDSGKIAEDLTGKIDIPKTPGKTQTITGTVNGSNTNTVVSTANVNLSLDNAYLEYIPGTAEWRHNAGTNDNVNYVTEVVSDDIVTKGTGLVLEDAKPCFNFEANVTILVRVKAAEVNITKHVRHLGQTSNDWKTENTADPGDTLEYLLTVQNKGNTTLNNVVVGDNLPAFMSYVPGTAMIKNGNNPNGAPLGSDNITTGGVNIGHYAPGSGAYVWFQVKIDDQLEECGTYTFKNVGLVKSDQTGTFENYAITKATQVCEEEKEFACISLSASPSKGKSPLKVAFTAKADVSDGVTVEQYIYSFGDGETATVSDSDEENVTEHTYTKVGDYTATVRIKTSEGTTEITDNCKVAIKVLDEKKPEVPDKPAPELPVTGPGQIMAATFGTGVLGTSIRSWVRSKRDLKNKLLGRD